MASERQRKNSGLQLARILFGVFLICLVACTQVSQQAESTQQRWSATELVLLQSLSLQNLTPEQPSWRNPRIGDKAAQNLGAALFTDKRLSGTGTLACSTCHDPARHYQDGLPKAQGLQPLTRNAPSLIGVAWRRWWYWDGRKDSLWSQALEPIESGAEMGGNRLAALTLILGDPALEALYTDAFGSLPSLPSPPFDEESKREIDTAFINVGIALAAFESTLHFTPTRFDGFVQELMNGGSSAQLSSEEQRGLKLFISGRTACVSCHSGPRFASDGFHNVGTGLAQDSESDAGRLGGVRQLAEDPLNCEHPLAPANKQCEHIAHAARFEVAALANGAFRVPSLRNLQHTAPYFHDGRFESLGQVLDHYRNPPNKAEVTHELSPLMLSPPELKELKAFLKSLSE